MISIGRSASVRLGGNLLAQNACLARGVHSNSNLCAANFQNSHGDVGSDRHRLFRPSA
jgi:hypothetical protein